MASPNHIYEHDGRDKVVGNEESLFRMSNHAIRHVKGFALSYAVT